jgi:uncharacterized protein (DUF4415 family)
MPSTAPAPAKTGAADDLLFSEASSSTAGVTTLMIDIDVVARFKATGPDWQERMAEVLRRAKP